jgi:hypothetical protein
MRIFQGTPVSKSWHDLRYTYPYEKKLTKEDVMQISKLVVRLTIVMVAGAISTSVSARPRASSAEVKADSKNSAGMNTDTFECAAQKMKDEVNTRGKNTNPPDEQVAKAQSNSNGAVR